MSSESPLTTAQRAELDAAQWRNVFAHLDALLGVLPYERMQAMSARVATIDDGVVASVLKDFCERTNCANAPDATGVAGATGIAAISQALLGGTQLAEGQRCGSYRLLEPIGQGGMGSVWRAERIDGLYQSSVAVKLLGSLALSTHARARFAREGELLARLSHANIARLLDAGLTDDHQRFLVLELVVGRDVVSHITAHPLEQKAMLLLFRQLLAAVAFAHRQLVVHRDIKPGNVMVTPEGQIKLLDFGVAKLLDESSEEAADNQLTRAVGAAYTEAYAAPEQLRGDPASTAADIFSCAALLHELLIGQRPQWAGPKHTLVAGQQAITLSSSSGSPSHDLATDLKAILAKALAIDPAERYATITAFDDDLASYLSGAPVRAQPSTRAYRLRKFAARNKLSVLLGAAASLAVLASLAVALTQLHEARAQRAHALAEAARANAVNAYITDLFDASDPRIASGQDRARVTAKDLLDTGARRLETSMDDQPETKLALLGTMAEIYAHSGDRARSDQLLQARIELAQARFGSTHPAIHDSKITAIWSFVFAGEHQLARQRLDDLEGFVAANPVATDDNVQRRANRLHLRARIERWAAKEPIERIVQRYEEALAEYARVDGNAATEDYASTLANYALALHGAKRSEDALAALDRALAMFERLPKRQLKDSGNLANTYSLRAQLAGNLGKKDEALASFDSALELYKKSYGAAHPMALNVRLYRARVLHQLGRRDEAWREIDGVSPQYTGSLVDAPVLYEPLYVRGQLLLAEGRNAEAVAMLQQAAEGWRNAKSNPRRLKETEQMIEKARATIQP